MLLPQDKPIFIFVRKMFLLICVRRSTGRFQTTTVIIPTGSIAKAGTGNLVGVGSPIMAMLPGVRGFRNCHQETIA